MEFTLLGAAILAFAAMGGILRWEAPRGNAAACDRNLFDLAVTAAVAGLVVGRLVAMIGNGVNPLTNPADIVIIRGGVSTPGAALGAMAAVAIAARTEALAAVDALAAAALAGLAGWHAGCLVRGSCLGTPSDLPWAMASNGSAVTRHPTELYAALLLGVGAVALAVVKRRSWTATGWWRRLQPGHGVVAGIALAWASAVRGVTEPLRPSLSGGPVGWYVAGVVVGLAVAATAAWRTGTADAPDA